MMSITTNAFARNMPWSKKSYRVYGLVFMVLGAVLFFYAMAEFVLGNLKFMEIINALIISIFIFFVGFSIRGLLQRR